jgi:hypothetical protein
LKVCWQWLTHQLAANIYIKYTKFHMKK